MFATTRLLEFGDLKVTVKELTVAEIRSWLMEPPSVEEPEFDLLTGLMAFDGIGMAEIYRFTDLSKAHAEQLPPSALKAIAATVKDLNSVFFNEYLVKLNEVRNRLEQDSLLKPSSGA